MHKKTVIDFKELKKRYIFTNPIKELKAEKLEEVGSVLKAVASYQSQGYYVVGYVSYEAAPYFEEKMVVHQERLAGEALAYFTVHDSVEQTDFPLYYEDVAMPDSWQELTSDKTYEEAIKTIHHHIRQGSTYQVNYTVRLKQELQADSFAMYNRLVVEQEAAYNAYIAHDDLAILSISPELFFKQEKDTILTRPMKGTVARGDTPSQDLEQAAWLKQDIKNRAENMMIVDLLRNDIGRICQIGSVQVTQLCQVEQYSTVWQMTSTIEGKLRENINLHGLFQALFPCGSITGAPKLATMKIIHELEPEPRGVYCGTVGICLPYQDSIFNVAIRTLQIHQQTAFYGVGGGITWDSKWQDELRETKYKSSILYRKQIPFELMTTGKITQGQLTFKEEHLNRLKEAARYFAYPCQLEVLEEKLQELLEKLDSDKNYRCRIALQKDGQWQLTHQELTALSPDFLHAKLVKQSHPLQSPFTYFKTSHRPHIQLDQHEQIFYNEKGQLLETSIGNLLIETDGQLFTPPLELGILNGIYRQHLLKTGQANEKELTLDDLKQAQKIYACNAVRGLYEIYS